MIGELFNNPLAFALKVIALILAITVHEFAHALAADRLGDPTPRLQGRLTLKPLAHLDPLGTLIMLIAGFGWGKPVIFDPYNLRHPRRDTAIISLAGPISNVLVAAIAAILLRIIISTHIIPGVAGVLLAAVLQPIIVFNIILAVFNLVPIHPLDGFKIVGGILPKEYAAQWQELEPYGMIFLLFLVFPLFGNVAPINQLISPVINMLLGILLPSVSGSGVI